VTLLCEFEVIGIPAPQGSKTAFRAKTGKTVTKESNALGHAAWRNAVAERATRARDHIAWGGPFDGPLGLSIDFRFPMPASRPKRLRALGEIPKVSAPDTSKLVRCVEDALQAAGLVVDDARFCAIEARKVETTGWTGASIRVTREDPS
jgi:Holliday junction resolvase RusA-like endonuclease